MAPIYNKINQQLLVWIESAASNREFAASHNIEEKTVRRMLEGNYQITIMTLEKICTARNIKLSDFFKLIEEK